MPVFRYQYRDSAGTLQEGMIHADSDYEAMVELMRQGVRGARVTAVPVNPAPSIPQPISQPIPQPAPAPVIHAAAAPSRAVSTPTGNPYSTPTVGSQGVHAAPPVIRTRRGTDKQRFFLFSQISKQLNAGINPSRVFEEIARITRIEHFRNSFRDLAAAATSGLTLSEVMARYPDLYPAHVVGTIRSAENGGFLPEAFEVLSNQAKDAHNFKRFHWFIWYLVPRAVVAIPLVFLVRAALLESADRSMNGANNPSSIFVQVVWERLLWPYGPLCLLIAGIMMLLRWWLGSAPMTLLRHKMGLQFPIYGARARNECIALFTWALSKLARAGVSPASSWRLAADTVPNLEMRERLYDAGRRMNDGSRLSEVIFGSGLFPEEYAPIISTGELTGDIESSLQQLADATRTEFEVSTSRAKWGSMRMGAVFAIVTSGAVLITLAYAWYNEFYSKILSFFE
jgi:type II secretory pathway component PulF